LRWWSITWRHAFKCAFSNYSILPLPPLHESLIPLWKLHKTSARVENNEKQNNAHFRKIVLVREFQLSTLLRMLHHHWIGWIGLLMIINDGNNDQNSVILHFACYQLLILKMHFSKISQLFKVSKSSIISIKDIYLSRDRRKKHSLLETI
jgi:hypothetical protein